MEKSELMPLLFSDADFELMRRVHDAFNPRFRVEPRQNFSVEQRLRGDYAASASGGASGSAVNHRGKCRGAS